jgi:hypothetical protein
MVFITEGEAPVSSMGLSSLVKIAQDDLWEGFCAWWQRFQWGVEQQD